MQFQRCVHYTGKRVAREVVLGGANSTGQDHDICRLHRFFEHRHDRIEIIGNGLVVKSHHALRGQSRA